MTSEITGKSVSLIEIDVDEYRATQFEAVEAYGIVPNWTSRWSGGISGTGFLDDEMPGGKGYLIVHPTSPNGQGLFSWNIPSTIRDVSTMGLFRFQGSGINGGIIVRGSGSDALKTGYGVRLTSSALQLIKFSSGVLTTLASVDFAAIAFTNYWIRFDAINSIAGVTVRANVWTGDMGDEPTGFMVFTDDASSIISVGGYVGLYAESVTDYICGFFRAKSYLDNVSETLRYAKANNYSDITLDSIPNIISIDQKPALLSLGETLGTRAQVDIRFHDHSHADLGEFFDNGTYWGKFRARNLFRRGNSLRVLTGLRSQAIADYETRNYVLESFNGPTSEDQFNILAQDILKFADNDRAQAPLPNNGYLNAAITNVQTTAILSPTNIGNNEYPTSGLAAIGGKEIVSFTRVGNNLTITRAQQGTTAIAHNAEDRVQVCKLYTANNVGEILYDLFGTYAGIDESYLPLYTWITESDNYLDRLYTRCIAEPTGVNRLVSELISQAGLIIWWDNVQQIVRMQVLRALPTNTFTYDETNLVKGSIDVTEQRNRLLTEVWCYYGVRNPLEPLNQVDNFRSSVVTTDLEAATLNGSPVIKKVFGTWIPALGRETAERAVDLLLSRFVIPPRKVSFSVPRYSGITEPQLAVGYSFSHHGSQDEAGYEALIPIQVVKVEPREDVFMVEAEEIKFESDDIDLVNRIITIDSNTIDFNLKTAHDSLYPPIVEADLALSPPVTVTCVISTGVVVSASSVNAVAFTVGTWLAGLSINLQIFGRITGAGGRGGDAVAAPAGPPTERLCPELTGFPGGTALYTRVPLNLEISSGQLWGGGGGATATWDLEIPAGFGGGGGAGKIVGPGGTGGDGSIALSNGNPGTETAGGEGGDSNGLFGGGPGEEGETDLYAIMFGVQTGPGGAAGKAIDGISYVNILTGYGDIRGTQVN